MIISEEDSFTLFCDTILFLLNVFASQELLHKQPFLITTTDSNTNSYSEAYIFLFFGIILIKLKLPLRPFVPYGVTSKGNGEST